MCEKSWDAIIISNLSALCRVLFAAPWMDVGSRVWGVSPLCLSLAHWKPINTAYDEYDLEHFLSIWWWMNWKFELKKITAVFVVETENCWWKVKMTEAAYVCM